MPAKKSASKKSQPPVKAPKNSFARFLSDPLVAAALIVFALIVLLFSILEFSKATAL